MTHPLKNGRQEYESFKHSTLNIHSAFSQLLETKKKKILGTLTKLDCEI